MANVFRSTILWVLAGWCSLSAQSRDAQITGQATDGSGAAVAHVNVKLYSRGSPRPYTAVTNEQGKYSLAVPKGEYLLEASAAGLSLPRSPRSLSLDGDKEIPLEMSVAEVTAAIQVTATGTAQSLNETAKAVDIVSREELDRRGVQSIAEGLRQTVGLRVEQRGGPGTNTTIQTRGLRTFDTAVLIDGMRFRDVAATQGDASSFITDLLVVDTARVEVLRGAGSSLYGTNAIGGVINIVTDPGGGPFHGNLTADGGGLGEFRALARFGGGGLHNRLHYSAGAGHQDVTDGVGGYGRYRNTTGNGLADYEFGRGIALSARILGTDAYGQLYQTAAAAPAANLPRTGYIPAVALSTSQILLAERTLPYALGNATFIPALGDPDYSRTAQFLSSSVALQQQVSAPFSYRVSYQALLSNRNVLNGPQGAGSQPGFSNTSQFNGRIDTLRGQANYAWGEHHLLSAAYEFEREYFDSPASDTNPDPAKRVNSRTQSTERSNSFDAQDQIRLLRDRLQISLSGRVQAFSLAKPLIQGTGPVYADVAAIGPPNAYTADASVAYFLPAMQTKIRAHGGNGYRKPSLFELFGTAFSGSTFTAYGDPRLTPERSIAIDGGFDRYFASDRLRLSATYFYTRLQQVIAFDSTGLIKPATDLFGRTSGYRNTGGGIARGAELSGEVKLRRATQLRASYTYTNARDRFPQFADGTLQTPRIAPHSFSLVALQQIGKHVDASFEFLAASDFLYQLRSRTFVFPGPRQAALAAGYTRPVTDRLTMRVYGRLNNLLDQVYYEDAFRTPRRWAIGGVAFSF